MFGNLRIRIKLLVMVGLAVLGIGIVATIDLIELKANLFEDRRSTLEQAVRLAAQAIELDYRQSQKAGLGAPETMERIKGILRSLHFGKDDYFLALDDHALVLAHPNPKLEGKSMMDAKDADGVSFAKEIVEAAARGGGFTSYHYPRAGGGEPLPKLAYSVSFKPYGWAIGGGIYLDDVDAIFRSQVRNVVGISGITLLLVIGAFFVVGRGITRPLTAIAATMRRLTEGDKAVPVSYTDRQDEIGGIARALMTFKANALEMEKLQGEQEEAKRRVEDDRKRTRMSLLTSIVGAGIQSGESVISMAHMKKDIDGANRQAQSIASAVEQLVTAIREIAQSADNVRKDSQDAEQAATGGVASSNQAVAMIEQIVQAVSHAAQEVQSLAAESGHIGEIVAQIEGIAAQTNLLALNATIEAARAGEAGKGFAVVATEVKSLANQTAKATEDIRARIDSLRSKMSGIVEAMGKGADAVDQGRQAAKSVGGELEDIVERFRSVTTKMAEISGILTQQTAAANEVSRGTQSIAGIAASNEREIVSVFKGLDKTSALLNAEIGAFADLGSRALVEIAKNDHVTFKKNVLGALTGMSDLTADRLPDHHNCRLGKWYDAIADEDLRSDAMFKALVDPHQRVHEAGKKALQCHRDGDMAGALAEVDRLNDASHEVLACLDRLAKSLADRSAAGESRSAA
jgi:methyl-accepting chemotaxis protein